MGFIKDYKKTTGHENFLITNAYWSISTINVDDNLALCVIDIKKSKEASEILGTLPFSFYIDTNGDNYHKQAYSRILSVSGFTDVETN